MNIMDGDDGETPPETFEDFVARAEGGEEGPEDGEEENPEGDEEEGSEGDEETDEKPKPKKTAEERIRDLNQKWREEQRAREIDRKGFEARLAAIEGKKPLTGEVDSGKKDAEEVAPDPMDLDKYPLGSLDTAYIQDAIKFHSMQEAKQIVDSLLQRQEQSEEQQAAEAFIAEVRSKADNVVTKGAELHDDYESVVLEAGLQGEYDLTQITFEAVAEAENGAQILYDLATDPAEATRVAKLSPLQQLKFVADRDAELSKGSKTRLPGAKPPPAQTPRGGVSRKTISPATSNFADFERLADATNQK